MSEPDLTFPCWRCMRPVGGIDQGRYISREDPQNDHHTRITLVSCPYCASPHVLSHDYTSEFGEWYWTFPLLVFPQSAGGLDARAVPPTVFRDYAEAASTLQNANFIATALMCRRTLETICDHLEAKGGNLNAKLKHLRDEGKIEPRIYTWADQVLRNLGNSAAHDVKDDVSQQDAEDAVKFTRAIID